MGRVVTAIDSAPGVDIDGAIRGNRELARVTDLVGKDGCTESARQTQSRIGLRTLLLFAECWDRAG